MNSVHVFVKNFFLKVPVFECVLCLANTLTDRYNAFGTGLKLELPTPHPSCPPSAALFSVLSLGNCAVYVHLLVDQSTITWLRLH